MKAGFDLTADLRIDQLMTKKGDQMVALNFRNW
jgi:hypothetical protein